MCLSKGQLSVGQVKAYELVTLGVWWHLAGLGDREVFGELLEFVGAKKKDLYTVWSSPFRRWRRSILSDHLLLGEARERYPCVGAPTWIRGERQLLNTTRKNPVVSCPSHLHSSIKFPLLWSFHSLLVCLTRTMAWQFDLLFLLVCFFLGKMIMLVYSPT